MTVFRRIERTQRTIENTIALPYNVRFQAIAATEDSIPGSITALYEAIQEQSNNRRLHPLDSSLPIATRDAQAKRFIDNSANAPLLNQITKLDLSKIEIPQIPKELSKLSNLICLVFGKRIPKIPAQMNWPPQLRLIESCRYTPSNHTVREEQEIGAWISKTFTLREQIVLSRLRNRTPSELTNPVPIVIPYEFRVTNTIVAQHVWEEPFLVGTARFHTNQVIAEEESLIPIEEPLVPVQQSIHFYQTPHYEPEEVDPSCEPWRLLRLLTGSMGVPCSNTLISYVQENVFDFFSNS